MDDHHDMVLMKDESSKDQSSIDMSECEDKDK